jgi:hypothetical protein
MARDGQPWRGQEVVAGAPAPERKLFSAAASAQAAARNAARAEVLGEWLTEATEEEQAENVELNRTLKEAAQEAADEAQVKAVAETAWKAEGPKDAEEEWPEDSQTVSFGTLRPMRSRGWRPPLSGANFAMQLPAGRWSRVPDRVGSLRDQSTRESFVMESAAQDVWRRKHIDSPRSTPRKRRGPWGQHRPTTSKPRRG